MDIRASHPRAVHVRGYAGSSRLDDKEVMVESGSIAEKRAKRVARALEQLGLPHGSIAVDWDATPAEGNGVTDADNRRVVIDIAM